MLPAAFVLDTVSNLCSMSPVTDNNVCKALASTLTCLLLLYYLRALPVSWHSARSSSSSSSSSLYDDHQTGEAGLELRMTIQPDSFISVLYGLLYLLAKAFLLILMLIRFAANLALHYPLFSTMCMCIMLIIDPWVHVYRKQNQCLNIRGSREDA